MSGKIAGFIVARGMAVLLWLHGVLTLFQAIPWAMQNLKLGNPIISVVPTFVNVVLYAAAALLLWRGAARFGPDDAGDEGPIDARSAVGVVVVAVSIFVLATHLDGLVNYLWFTVNENERRYFDMRPRYWSDVATCIAAGLTLALGLKNSLAIRQTSAYQEESGDAESL